MNRRVFGLIGLAITITVFASGCGDYSVVSRPKTGSGASASSSMGSAITVGATGPTGGIHVTLGGSGGTGNTGSTGDTGPTGPPPYSSRVGAVGYTGVTISVKANKVLKVRFQPGVQDDNVIDCDTSKYDCMAIANACETAEQNGSSESQASQQVAQQLGLQDPTSILGGLFGQTSTQDWCKKTGFAPEYSGLGVYIKVGSYEKATPLLSNGLTDGQAKFSSAMDFSTAFKRTCTSDQPDCRQDVTITIEKPNYDYWCINYGQYCPWAHVYETHPWHGTLEIQTDDTAALSTDPYQPSDAIPDNSTSSSNTSSGTNGDGTTLISPITWGG